jgi:hypothetical protein
MCNYPSAPQLGILFSQTQFVKNIKPPTLQVA